MWEWLWGGGSGRIQSSQVSSLSRGFPGCTKCARPAWQCGWGHLNTGFPWRTLMRMAEPSNSESHSRQRRLSVRSCQKRLRSYSRSKRNRRVCAAGWGGVESGAWGGAGSSEDEAGSGRLGTGEGERKFIEGKPRGNQTQRGAALFLRRSDFNAPIAG